MTLWLRFKIMCDIMSERSSNAGNKILIKQHAATNKYYFTLKCQLEKFISENHLHD